MAPPRRTGHPDAPCTGTKFTLRPSVGVALRDLSSRGHRPRQRGGISMQTCRMTNQCETYTHSFGARCDLDRLPARAPRARRITGKLRCAYACAAFRAERIFDRIPREVRTPRGRNPRGRAGRPDRTFTRRPRRLSGSDRGDSQRSKGRLENFAAPGSPRSSEPDSIRRVACM